MNSTRYDLDNGYYIIQDRQLGGYALYHENLDGVPMMNPPHDNRIGYGDTIRDAKRIAQEYEDRPHIPFWRNERILAELKKS
jgi:hypothetical protein